MLTHKGTKTIKTQRLILRRFSAVDALDMFNNWANDKRVTKFLSWEPHGNIENTRHLLNEWEKAYNDKATYNWAIEYDYHAIGGISVVRYSERDEYIELGYCLSYDFWNKGFMSEAVMGVIEFLFNEINANKVCISHAVKNPASGIVAQKCGLKLEGIKREDFKLKNGEFLDIAIYSILKKE